MVLRPGMSMAPLFEEVPGQAQQGSMKGSGESGSASVTRLFAPEYFSTI